MQKNLLVFVTFLAHNDSQKLFIRASSLFGKCFKYLIDGVYQESCRTNALSPHHGQQVSSASAHGSKQHLQQLNATSTW